MSKRRREWRHFQTVALCPWRCAAGMSPAAKPVLPERLFSARTSLERALLAGAEVGCVWPGCVHEQLAVVMDRGNAIGLERSVFAEDHKNRAIRPKVERDAERSLRPGRKPLAAQCVRCPATRIRAGVPGCGKSRRRRPAAGPGWRQNRCLSGQWSGGCSARTGRGRRFGRQNPAGHRVWRAILSSVSRSVKTLGKGSLGTISPQGSMPKRPSSLVGRQALSSLASVFPGIENRFRGLPACIRVQLKRAAILEFDLKRGQQAGRAGRITFIQDAGGDEIVSRSKNGGDIRNPGEGQIARLKRRAGR